MINYFFHFLILMINNINYLKFVIREKTYKYLGRRKRNKQLIIYENIPFGSKSFDRLST